MPALTQNQKILDYLKSCKTLNTLVALEKFV